MSKRKTVFKRISLGVTIFAASLAGAYFLTPNKVKQSVFNLPEESEGSGILPSHFAKFVETFTEETGISDTTDETRERHYYGLHAELDDFSLSFKIDENSAQNMIILDGNIDLLMKGLKDITFNLDVDIDYNGKQIPLEVGYVNNTAYFGLKNLRMKVSSTTTEELLGTDENPKDSLIYDLFVASEEEGGLAFNIEEFIDSFGEKIASSLEGFDLSNLASNFTIGELAEDQTGIGVQINEKQKENGWDFDIDLTIKKENEETHEITTNDISATISVDEEYHLTKVDLGTINIGNFTIQGAIDIECIKDYAIVAPDNPEYVRYNPNYEYVEVINYRGWLKKLARFLSEDEQKFGLDFALDLDSDNAEIGKVAGSINADFSELIDLSEYHIDYGQENGPTKKNRNAIIDKIINKATFGIDLKLYGQEEEEFGNLAIKYTDGQGYLNINESLTNENELKSVMKAKVETETINWLVSELPGMISSLTGDNESSSLTSLFSFVTESEFVQAIKNKDYSSILDLIKDIRNDEEKIVVAADLSSIGLGDNAEVDLDINSLEDEKVLNLDINNIKLGSLKVNASIHSDGYKEISINEEEEDYDSLSFLPTVFDQVATILDTKQAGFSIEGSVLDNENLGIKLSGQGQFDYGSKYGFGNLTIDQYKYRSNELWYSHKIALDVDNTTSNYSNNNAYFVYGDQSADNNIKGKVTIQSVLDIVDVIKTFLSENKDNPKFTKFIEPIMKMMSMSQLGEIISNKNYLRFFKNDLLKSISKNENTIDIVIGGSLFELDSDINIKVNLADDKISSLSLSNFALSSGKIIDLTIKLEDYNANATSSVDKTGSFIDLSTISLLLKFGINTTKNNYYHLSADIDLSAISIINVNFSVEVYILVKDTYVKIYGVMPDVKLVNGVLSLADVAVQDIGLTASGVTSEFTFETYSDDDPNKTNDVGGYFHIKTTEKHRWISDKVRHYKTTSENLIKSENIMTYLLNDMLLMRQYITDKIGDISSNDEEKEAGNFTNLFTDTGYQYNEASKRWDIGINLNEITGISALKDLELSIFADTNNFLKQVNANLNIGASNSLVTVGATLKVLDSSTTATNWSNDIESAFNAINSVSFSDTYLNNPTKYLSY